MNEQASFDIQVQQLWAEMGAWLSSHSVEIVLGFAAGAIIVLLLLGMKWIGVRICGTDPGHIHWRTVVGRVLAGTRIWFMIAFAARLVVGYAGAPPSVTSTIKVLYVIVATLQVALWARELVLGLLERRAGGIDNNTGLGSAIGIIRLLVTITIFVIAIVVVLDNLGVNVTGLVAGLGIGGVAIGLAAKGIFDDLFSALSIIFDKPFRRGDLIRWDGTSGTVEQIGLKTTRVRATTGEEVVISNTNLLNKELHNLARLQKRRINEPFSVAFDTPPDKLALIPELVAAIVAAQPKCKFVRCGMARFSKGFTFEVQFDVASKIWQEVFAARSAVLIAIRQSLADEEIVFTENV